MLNFVFGSVPALQYAILARVPARIATKQELMDVLYAALALPDYFGENWDALEECVRDFSWLPPGAVALVHDDVPLRGDRESLRTYLSILTAAVEKWVATAERQFVVVFPEESQEQIYSGLGQ